jgi:ergothioneine biosynthesis protein EgtB
MPHAAEPAAIDIVTLLEHCLEVRADTDRLAQPLSAEDAVLQSMPDASPVKWHLAHTSWFFDTFVLAARGFVAPQPSYRQLYNSYYNVVGVPFPRAQRGLISRPSLDEVGDYRRQVDAALASWHATARTDGAAAALLRLGVHHEQQHQELLLTDVKHLLSLNPLAPAYRTDLRTEAGAAGPLRWLPYDGGLVDVGHDGDGFAFDNEGPRHRVYLEPFALAQRLTTNGDYLAFIEDGGYAEPRWWMADGWTWRSAQGIEQPLYWRRADGGGWHEFTLGGERALDIDAPVAHLSWYEADAFARWSGARLPTEAEWEHAVHMQANDMVPVDRADVLHPMPAAAEGTVGLLQIVGEVWQWTASSFSSYPGFAPAAGAVGEYNGKFMCNQYVLRGGSCATPRGHTRPTYRNFFAPDKRWQFSGVRLARDRT